MKAPMSISHLKKTATLLVPLPVVKHLTMILSVTNCLSVRLLLLSSLMVHIRVMTMAMVLSYPITLPSMRQIRASTTLLAKSPLLLLQTRLPVLLLKLNITSMVKNPLTTMNWVN
jgi:hypothetical protein